MNLEMSVAIIALLILVAVFVRGRWFGFAAQKPQDYAQSNDVFDIKQQLNGNLLCEGVIFGPLGRVSSRFVAQMDAEWTGDTCVMHERFQYAGGRSQDRKWQLTLGANGQISALADDVIGQGHGAQKGDAVQLCYKIALPKDAGGHVLDVVDWMYLTPNRTIINRSEFRKFGFKVAELVATMRSVPGP